MILSKLQNRKMYCSKCFDMSSPPKCHCFLKEGNQKLKTSGLYTAGYALSFLFAFWFGVRFILGY